MSFFNGGVYGGDFCFNSGIVASGVDVKSFNAEGRRGKRRVSQRNARREMQGEKCKERNIESVMSMA
jgi:hypothetical protein